MQVCEQLVLSHHQFSFTIIFPILGSPWSSFGRHWLNKRLGAGIMWGLQGFLVWTSWILLLALSAIKASGVSWDSFGFDLKVFTKYEAAFLVQQSWLSSFSAVSTGFALQSLFVQVHCSLRRSSCNSCLSLRVGLLEWDLCSSGTLILSIYIMSCLFSLFLLVWCQAFREGSRKSLRMKVSRSENPLCWWWDFSLCFVPLLVCLGNFWLWDWPQNNLKPYHAPQTGLFKRVSQELPLEPCFCFR